MKDPIPRYNLHGLPGDFRRNQDALVLKEVSDEPFLVIAEAPWIAAERRFPGDHHRVRELIETEDLDPRRIVPEERDGVCQTGCRALLSRNQARFPIAASLRSEERRVGK